jgi:superfamily II DNA or RNA helicase
MSKIFKDKLYEYQIEHTDNIVRIIDNNKSVLDASDTGTGKTYTAAAACAILKLNPIIICPKSVVSNWKRVCSIFNVKPLAVVNYELIQRGKIEIDGKHKKTKYIAVNDNYVWNLPQQSIFIFDEVHKCAEPTTNNGRLLLSAKDSDSPIMILSATIADRPEKFFPFFYILNFISPEQTKQMKITYTKYMNIMNSWIYRDNRPMVRIHNMLYPDRATRMRIDVLGDMFPESQITAIPYSLGTTRENEIQREYKNLANEIDALRNKQKKDKGGILPMILRAHQKIELLKIPTFIELANDFIHNGYSVVIFINFTKTLETIADMLHTKNTIHGQQTQQERDSIIDDFQSNKINVIVCNIKAGGLGISLHDVHGGHPRASIISPTWSSIDLLQALGRIHRAGGKSKSLQRIIYTANTVEEKIADKLKHKLNNINSINNGDLDLSNVEFITEHKNI